MALRAIAVPKSLKGTRPPSRFLRMPNYRRKRWRAEMTVRLDANGALAAIAGEGGLEVGELEAMAPRFAQVLEGWRQRWSALPFWGLAARRNFLAEISELAEELRNEFDTLVVLGAEGTALGTRALVSALRSPFQACRPEAGPRVILVEGFDSGTLMAVLEEVDPRRTVFDFVSPSGSCPAMLAQFLVVRDRLLRALGGVDYARHLVVTTDSGAGPLRQIVNDEGFRALAVPSEARGPRAVFSSASLLPAAVAGIDLGGLLAGCADMAERCSRAALFENPAGLFATIQYLACARGVRLQLVVPCAGALAEVAEWHARVWNEALASRQNGSTEPPAVRQFVAAARGGIEREALAQLLLAGPADRIATFFVVQDPGAAVEIPSAYLDLEEVAYLGGRTLGEYVELEQRAAEILLSRRGALSTSVRLPRLDPYTIGQLLAWSLLGASFAAELWRIEPLAGVAAAETVQLVGALAGRRGLEEVRPGIDEWMRRRLPRFVV